MEIKERKTGQINIIVKIPHLDEEYEVSVPEDVLVSHLHNALLNQLPALRNISKSWEMSYYELFYRELKETIYPDKRDYNLSELGVNDGDTIIVIKGLDPG